MTLLHRGFLDRDWLDEAGLIVTELVANAVHHAGGCIAVIVSDDQGCVMLTVVDASTARPRRRAPDEDGGRGLILVEGLCSAWGVTVHDGGKHVWARIRVHPG